MFERQSENGRSLNFFKSSSREKSFWTSRRDPPLKEFSKVTRPRFLRISFPILEILENFWRCREMAVPSYFSLLSSKEKITKKHFLLHCYILYLECMAEFNSSPNRYFSNFPSAVHFEEKSHCIYPSFDKLISDERFQVEEKLNETVASLETARRVNRRVCQDRHVSADGRKKPTKLERRKVTAGVQWLLEQKVYIGWLYTSCERENVTSHLATLHIPLPGYLVHRCYVKSDPPFP